MLIETIVLLPDSSTRDGPSADLHGDLATIFHRG
jgi:hypothetical protein